MPLNHSPTVEAKLIEVEAIRRAAIDPESFIDERATPAQRRDVRLALARRYDSMVELYNLDAGYSLEDRLRAEVAKA